MLLSLIGRLHVAPSVCYRQQMCYGAAECFSVMRQIYYAKSLSHQCISFCYSKGAECLKIST